MSAGLCLALLVASGCAAKSPNQVVDPEQVRELTIGAGDLIFVVNDQRERFVLEVDNVTADGVTGLTMESKRSSIAPDQSRLVPFESIALLQVEYENIERAFDAAMMVTVVGTLVLTAALIANPPVIILAPK